MKKPTKHLSPVHYNEEKVKAITQTYSSSMSNKKWHKLFELFYENDFFRKRRAVLKTVWDEERERSIHMPRSSSDYWEVGIEGGVEGFHRWCFYAEIEWLKFPKEFYSHKMSKTSHQRELVIESQDTQPLVAFFKTIPFQLDWEELDDSSVIIYGYRK